MSFTVAQARSLLTKIARRRVLVIGDVMLDHYIWGDSHRISPEAPVPVVAINRDTYVPGGAANVALNCAALGATTTVLGAIGRDEAGRTLRRLLADAVTALAAPVPGPTIVKARVILQRQQLCRLDREAAPASYHLAPARARRLLAPALAAADTIILSDYAKGLLTTELVAWIISTARAAGKFIALDPKPRNPLAAPQLDLFTPNRREAAELADVSWVPGQPFPADAICERLHTRYGMRHLVITLSEDGMLLSTAGRPRQQIPTAAREVFDVSGAGDTSIASLALALAAGADLPTAAHFANAAAGVVVGKLGTATAAPAEILAHLALSPRSS